MKKIIVALLFALSLSTGWNSQAGTAKKVGNLTVHGLKIAVATVIGTNVRDSNHHFWVLKGHYDTRPDSPGVVARPFDSSTNDRLHAACVPAAIYLFADGCYGIYNELKTWNEDNDETKTQNSE